MAAGLGVVGLGMWAGISPESQVFGRFPYAGPGDERVIALSFDDGPNEPYTSELLAVLADRDVRATFFVVGRCAERYPDTVRQLAQAGHLVGNHSYSHQFGRYLREPRQRQEVGRASAVLTELLGVTPALYRPPWLCHWPWVLRTVRASGLQVVSGHFGHPLEVLQPPAAVLAASALRQARPGGVLILHDGFDGRGGRRDQTVAAVGPLIDRLRDDGYRFVTVAELLGAPDYLGA